MNVFGLPSPPEPFIDREELAGLLGVSSGTVDAFRRVDGFPEHRWGPRTVRFRFSEVLDWLERQRRAA